jgi:hypothetical protein
MTPTPPQEQTEREALTRLARFGAAMLRAHRGISPGEIGDIDGFTAQDEAVKCGVLETRTVTAPCGPSCECVGLFPTECHFVPDAVGRLRRSFEASDKAKGPGEQHRGPEAGQEPPTHEGSVAALQREVEELRARHQWLRDRFLGADFDWGQTDNDGDHGTPVLLIKFDGVTVYGDLDCTIAAALASKAEVPNG